MDFQDVSIDPRLAQAAERSGLAPTFYAKLFDLVLSKEENLCLKISLKKSREELVLLPAVQWLLDRPGRKAMILCPDEAFAARLGEAARNLGAGTGADKDQDALNLRLFKLDKSDSASSISEDPAEAALVIGSPAAFLASGLDLRCFAFLVIDGLDRFAEQNPDELHRLVAALLPPWERKTILAGQKLSLKAKNLAWDLADNPAELSIEAETAMLEGFETETFSVSDQQKLRFLLGLLGREAASRVCLFCNLRDTASELCRRLEQNGIASTSLSASLPLQRRIEFAHSLEAGACRCLLLTDQAAEGLEIRGFQLVINYDIPLDPELFMRRLKLLDASEASAKLVNIACERYMYGLPAVESLIKTKLEVRAVSEEMLAAQDRSQGRPAEGYDRRPKPYENRGRAPDRSPDIRKSISEATGGSLDVNSQSAAPRSPAERPRSQAKEPAKPASSPKNGPRPAAKANGARPDLRSAASSRPQPHRQGGGKPKESPRSREPAGGPASSKAGNPYDLPIEERMKLYRQKYGQKLGGEAGQNPAPKEGGAQVSRTSSNEGMLGRFFGAFARKPGKS